MKLSIFLFTIIFLTEFSYAQSLYFTRNGKVNFFSKTSMENIDAVNNEVFSVIDMQKGEIAFAILIKSFRFEKALMEEHFNENYMESTKFPKATFNGKIVDFSKVQLNKDGVYPVEVSGDLTIHGVTKKISTEGRIKVVSGSISSQSNFILRVKDYNISIPSLVADKIAETIEVTVECNYTLK